MSWFTRVRVLEYSPGSRLCLRRPYSPGSLEGKVKSIVDEVERLGDEALARYLERFHGVRGVPVSVEDWEFDEAYKLVEGDVVEAMREAYGRALEASRAARPGDVEVETAPGVRVGISFKPVGRVGVYAPAGRARYPSTALMVAAAARAAGVGELYLSSPPTRGASPDPYVLVAADIAGYRRVYRLGGAYAAAAMALGTESVARVDVLSGPGGAWFTEAKRILSARVGVDVIAGPTELFIIADGSVEASWVAWDLAAQAEHSPDSFIVVASQDRGYLERVLAEVESIASRVGTGETILEALSRGGYVVAVRDLRDAVELANEVAPEHVYIAVDGSEAWELASRIFNAGAVTVGPYAAPALNDYSTGANHVLPTGGWARVQGGLSPLSFLRPVYTVEVDREGFRRSCGPAETLAAAEGLPAHAGSLRVRGC